MARIFIKATRDIAAGDELFVRYAERTKAVAMGKDRLPAGSEGHLVRARGKACDRD